MSKLDELIQEFCPEGVEYKTLGEIATEIYRGAGIKRDQVTETGTPCVRYGEIYTTYGIWFDKCVSHTDEATVESKKYFEYGDILFAITGESIEDIAKSCAYVGHEKCLAGGDIVVLKHNENPKYLAYALSTTEAREQKSKGKVKSKVVHSSVPAIQAIKIPVPPMEVQSEIVRILDNFIELTTELIAELTKEFIARKKQYEYYRNYLLNYNDMVKADERPLGQCCTLKAGKAISATEILESQTEEFRYPCYGANGHRGYTRSYNQSGKHCLIGRQGALCGNVCYATGDFYATEHAVVVSHGEDIDDRYMFHLLTAANLNQYKTAGAQPGLSVSRLEAVNVFIPKIEIQRRVA